MSFILIPHIVSTDSAMIWVGAVDEKVRINPVSIDYNIIGDETDVKSYKLSPSEWRAWKSRQPLEWFSKKSTIDGLHYQRITITGLKPRHKYVFKLKIGKKEEINNSELSVKTDAEFTDYSKVIDREVTSEVYSSLDRPKATVTTLPERLPKAINNEKPFTVMLGSCFYQPNDPDGLVGKTFIELPEDQQPELKFLCGDQVYLDNPWSKTTWNMFLALSPREKMRKIFFEKYLMNWTQINRAVVPNKDGIPTNRAVGGFNLLLRNGANYFCSDDHEFWNNAPNFGFVGAALTIRKSQRRWWFKEASELFRVFQSLAPWMTFDVDPLSFCIVDSRINRIDGDDQFMEEYDLDAIGNWIQNLKGPGVLVMGQVLMQEKSSYFTAKTDLALPDFERQYQKLLDYIKCSDHSIVFITGDVHFGRVAVCDLDAGKGTKFVEVISSPMMVVSNMFNKPKVGEFKKAPETFDTPVKNYQMANLQNHFATLEFIENTAGTIEMTVKAWKILSPETNNKPDPDVIVTIPLT